MVQDLQHIVHIAEIGDAMDNARFFGQQSRGENWQRRVFGATDLNRSRQSMAPVYNDLIHT